jgi:hypothetical protein
MRRRGSRAVTLTDGATAVTHTQNKHAHKKKNKSECHDSMSFLFLKEQIKDIIIIMPILIRARTLTDGLA